MLNYACVSNFSTQNLRVDSLSTLVYKLLPMNNARKLSQLLWARVGARRIPDLGHTRIQCNKINRNRPRKIYCNT